MNKTVIAGGIVAAAIIVSITYGAVANPGGDPIKEEPSSEVWNFRFSGQEFHNISSHGFDGISLETGNTYQFKFVPMGDSPEQLRLSLVGISPSVQVFSDTLYLKKTLVDTGISKYYTWEYVGDKFFQISDKECYEKDSTSSTILKKPLCYYELNVERIGNLMGSVSISIEKLDRSI
tara:strand:+ start:13 stop:543 length:531 start_codon:yes stop_codon:yes gene_type:complete